MAYDILGEQHTTTAFRRQVLAEIHRGAGNFEAALTNADRAVAGYRATLGLSHPRAAAALAAKARVLSDAGRYEEAAEAFGKALAILRNPSSPGGAYHQARAGYAQLLVRTGRPVEAEPILRDAVANLARRSAADHDRWTVFAKTALAECLEAQGLYRLAEPIREELLRIYDDHFGPGHPATRAARRALRRSSHARADTGRRAANFKAVRSRARPSPATGPPAPGGRRR
jgi:tetratricopeptide (TPR) repeat protein